MQRPGSPWSAVCFKCSATGTRMGVFCVSPKEAGRRLPAASAGRRRARAKRAGCGGGVVVEAGSLNAEIIEPESDLREVRYKFD